MNDGTSKVGMPCPNCRVDLVMSERSGIEIDYCPKCRGVWLDRGELDKLIERSMASERPTTAPAAPQPSAWMQPAAQPSGHSSWDNRQGGHGKAGHGSGNRRRSWLGEIFD